MRLLELHIDGFGKFHDRTISFNDGINIIYGKKQAQKSATAPSWHALWHRAPRARTMTRDKSIIQSRPGRTAEPTKDG